MQKVFLRDIVISYLFVLLISFFDLSCIDSGNIWPARSHFGAVSHNGSLFVMGGIKNDNSGIILLNDIWKSSDNGVTWAEVEVEGVHWSARFGFGAISHNGSLFVMGGGVNALGSVNIDDIWKSSDDGVTWERVNVAEGALALQRTSFSIISHKNNLYIAGGLEVVPRSDGRFMVTYFDDIWKSSDDGVTWSNVVLPDSAPYIGRSSFGFVSHEDQLFIMGGRTGTSDGEGGVLNDIWKSSDDGVTWTEIVGLNPPWSVRNGFGAVSYNGELVVVAGFNDWSGTVPFNDIYKSRDNGEFWSSFSVGEHWPARGSFGAIVHNDSLFIFGGYDGGSTYFNDVWELKRNGDFSNVVGGTGE